MRNRSVKTIVAGAFFAAALACNAQVLEIRGSTVVEKDVLLPAAAAIKSATGVEIKVLGMGSGRGMTALFEGKTSVGGNQRNTRGSRCVGKEIGRGRGIERHGARQPDVP